MTTFVRIVAFEKNSFYLSTDTLHFEGTTIGDNVFGLSGQELQLRQVVSDRFEPELSYAVRR